MTVQRLTYCVNTFRNNQPGNNLNPEQPIVVLITVPDEATATGIATELVESGLAACVNILPAVRSIYRWEGKVHSDSELLLIVKTIRSKLVLLSDKVIRLHPYTLPEIIVLDITGGFAGYLHWVVEQTTS